MEKLEPLVHIFVFPLSEIDVPAGAGAGSAFAIADVYRGYLLPMGGESGEGNATASDNYKSLEWQGQPAFETVENLEFFRFLEDSTAKSGVAGLLEGQGMGGWTLKVTPKPLNCVMTPAKTNDPVPGNNFRSVTWKSKKGTSWETYVPAKPPYQSVIRHREQMPNKTIEAVATLPLDAAGWEVQIDWNGVMAGHTQDPGFRLVLIENEVSLVWRKVGTKPTLERWQNTVKVVNNAPVVTMGWVGKTLEDAKPVTFTGSTIVRGRMVSGRPVLSLDDKTYYFMKTRARPAPNAETPPETQAIESEWKSKTIRISSFGVDARVSMRYLDEAEEGRLVVNRPAKFRHKEAGGGEELCTKKATTGWKPAGTQVTLTGRRKQNKVRYELRLKANRKKTASPFVSSSILQWDGATNKTSAAPIDIRPAGTMLKVSSGEPELLPSAEAQITLDRTLLNRLVPDWTDYVVPFAPVRILATWKYLNDAAAIELGEWSRLIDGYIMNDAKELQDYQQQSLTLVVRDGMARIREPAGYLDERFAPLDFLFAGKGGAPLYGGECYQYMLTVELGSEIAGRLNGTGDPLEFFTAHYPLISADTDRCGYFNIQLVSGLNTQEGFMMPVPYDSSIYNWASEVLAKPDHAVMLWGDVPDTPVDEGDDYAFGTRPTVPIYGRLINIMAALGSEPRVLPDAVYLEGDANDLVGAASSTTTTDKAWNEFVVRGPKPQGVTGIFTPALFSGRARLPADDPNSPDLTWSRVFSRRYDFIGTIVDQNFARDLATFIMREFQGVMPRNVTIFMPRGEGNIRWGGKVKPKFQSSGSDNTIDLNDKTFRVKRIEHTLPLDSKDPLKLWTTELICRPLSPSGL